MSTWCSELRAHHELLLQGVNVTALREIKLLKELTCPNVVQLVDVFQHKQNLSLVRPDKSFPARCCRWGTLKAGGPCAS